MSFYHQESESKWPGESAWPRLCWRYSVISAGNLSDSFPSSFSTWPPGASSSCTLALSGTAAPVVGGAGTLWQLQRWAAGLYRQALGGLASWAECLRRHAGPAGGMALHGWRRLGMTARRQCAGGGTTPATGTVHLKDAMPRTWMMEEVGQTFYNLLSQLVCFQLDSLSNSTSAPCGFLICRNSNDSVKYQR